jgi:hypothetical protein
VTSDELRRYANELAALETSGELPANRITDISEAEGLDLHFDEIGSFAAQRCVAPLKNIVKSAIFAPTDVQFGMARMFQTLNDNPKIRIKVFRDLRSATDWLDGKSANET